MFRGLAKDGSFRSVFIPRWGVHKIIDPFEFQSLGTTYVPKGFVTDLTSFYKEGKHTPAAVCHDADYAKGYIFANGCKVQITRREADQRLVRGMTELGVPKTQRRLIWYGVRLGGWRPWRKYRKAQRQGASV